MTDMTLSVTGELHDKERALDWLTAGVPLMVIAWIYYGWWVAALLLLSVAGYLAAAALLQWAGLLTCRALPALATGIGIVCFLPATAPLWVPALAGGVAAAAAAVPALVSRRFAGRSFARPLLSPVLCGVLVLFAAYPALQFGFTMPAQWTANSTAVLPALEGLFDPSVAVDRWWLFFGVYPGGIGETCSPVIWMVTGYLLLRRRVRLLPVVGMYATVALLSWLVWGSPLYSLLAGSTLLCAMLLGDRTVSPDGYGSGLTTGVAAGILTVVFRSVYRIDGSVAAVLIACAAAPLYPPAGRLLRRGAQVLKNVTTKIITKYRKIKNNG